MNRSYLERIILPELRGRLWHTTHPDRFQGILNVGAILPEPDIPDAERWKTTEAPKYYPYVRTLGGVSLFDFENFDPLDYSAKYPLSSWREFVPFRRSWGCAVWVEINRTLAAPNFIPGTALVDRWKADGAYRHTFMPHIEAAHLGELPKTAFVRAFIARDGTEIFEPLELR